MSFPHYDYCLICKGIRFEIGNKFTILGFSGMTPNIEILVSNLTTFQLVRSTLSL